MAKVKQITDGENTLTITPKSKNSTYKYTGSGAYEFNMTTVSPNGYQDKYYNFGTRKNDDLVVTTVFVKNSGKIKKVTTTIKGYFTNLEADYSVKYKSVLENFGVTSYTINPNTTPQNSGLFSTENAAEGPYYILGDDSIGDETHTMNGTTGRYYYDRKGNDEYVDEMSGGFAYTYDMAGKDVYTVDGMTRMYAHDFAGNDIYEAGEDSHLFVDDFAGNDEYTVGEDARFMINDYKGNDTYLVEENAEISEGDTIFLNRIMDYKGNDKYTFDSTSMMYVFDKGGKDTYNITSDEIEIHDEGKGNDKYNIISASGMEYDATETFYIQDEKGNETYNISTLAFDDAPGVNDYAIYDTAGNDKYIFKNTDSDDLMQNVSIYDASGKDKYTFVIDENNNTNDAVDHVYITDKKGADSYTVKGMQDNTINYVTISDMDKKSKDKYNFAWTADIDIADAGGDDKYTLTKCDGIIEDKGGKDKYIVDTMSNWDVSIIDKGKGKDSYKVTMNAKSFVEIADGGGKDSLVLSGSKKDDIVFMVDVRRNGDYGVIDDTLQLLIYNRNTDSLIAVDDFYAVNGNDITGFGDGRIESIKTSLITTLKGANNYDNFDNLRSNVAGWLDSNDKAGVYAILTSNDADAKEALVAYFTGGQPS